MKNKIITVSFLVFILTFSIINLFLEDRDISIIERRKLTTFPTININTILNGSSVDEFEKYTLDQFPFRDTFLKVKTFVDYNLLKKLDSNNLFTYEDHIYKLDYPLKESEVYKFSEKLNTIYNTYLTSMNVYYSVIPDKNYFLDNEDYLKIDYDKMLSILDKEIENIKYINIIDPLNINDYYFTDLHWKQENLDKVVSILAKEMDFSYSNNFKIKNEYSPFYGAYYGNGFKGISYDKIIYLTNEAIENSVIYNYENKNNKEIYNTTKLGSLDSYDVFLDGATPYIEIYNKNSNTSKELIIFRDSFSSSLAPLLLEGYSKITLIDLRYMPTSSLENFIEFNNQDVLFLYNTSIINNSSMLK